jgi:hypothetical protein
MYVCVCVCVRACVCVCVCVCVCIQIQSGAVVMKLNESAKEHPVSFVGNQIRGTPRR